MFPKFGTIPVFLFGIGGVRNPTEEISVMNKYKPHNLLSRLSGSHPFLAVALSMVLPVLILAAVPIKSSAREQQVGTASWYGPGFHGKKTASGNRFNQNALTAAHRSLPFGTKARVTNLRNGKKVVVQINDRGPHRRGRIIDLSRAAAQQLSIHGAAQVRVEVIN